MRDEEAVDHGSGNEEGRQEERVAGPERVVVAIDVRDATHDQYRIDSMASGCEPDGLDLLVGGGRLAHKHDLRHQPLALEALTYSEE